MDTLMVNGLVDQIEDEKIAQALGLNIMSEDDGPLIDGAANSVFDKKFIEALQKEDEEKPDPELLEKCVCLSFSIGRFGTRRKVDTKKIDAGNADKKLLHVAKEILESKELAAIKSADAFMRSYLARRCNSASCLKRSFYMLATSLVGEVDEKLQKYKKERENLVEAFIISYPALKGAAETKLGHLYNPGDYPSEDEIRKAFKVDIRYEKMSVPGTLKDVSEEIFNREKKRLHEQMELAATEMRDALRMSFQELVDHLLERLEPGEDGKPKRFKKSTIEFLQDFVQFFGDRNVVGDNELTSLVKQASGLIEGVDPDAIRKNSSLREVVHGGFKTIQQNLNDLIEVSGSRKYNFDDDPFEDDDESI